MSKQTHFGFETVSTGEKRHRVQQLFDRVSGSYDRMNDVMSGGLHRLWKKNMVHRLTPVAGACVIDVAGGTGDIALRIAQTYPHLDLDITVYDLTPSMLVEGRHKAVDQGILGRLQWACGQAEFLPFPDASVDLYTVAFGLRNVGDLEASLSEAYRVLRPGGVFYCLEFSQVTQSGFSKIYDAYSMTCIPQLGHWIANDREAYQYLVESIRRFPSQSQFAGQLTKAGFGSVKWDNFLGGIAALHSARKEVR